MFGWQFSIFGPSVNRLVEKSMVCCGEIVELWRCSREITALARNAGCRLLLTVKLDRRAPMALYNLWTVVVRAVVSRGQQSREHTAGTAEFGMISPRQTFNDCPQVYSFNRTLGPTSEPVLLVESSGMCVIHEVTPHT